MYLVAQGVHRLPKTMVLECGEISFFRQALQWFALPDRLVIDDVVDDLRRQYEEPSVDHGAIPLGLFLKAVDFVVAHIQRTETSWRKDSCQSGLDVLRLMEGD